MRSDINIGGEKGCSDRFFHFNFDVRSYLRLASSFFLFFPNFSSLIYCTYLLFITILTIARIFDWSVLFLFLICPECNIVFFLNRDYSRSNVSIGHEPASFRFAIAIPIDFSNYIFLTDRSYTKFADSQCHFNFRFSIFRKCRINYDNGNATEGRRWHSERFFWRVDRAPRAADRRLRRLRCPVEIPREPGYCPADSISPVESPPRGIRAARRSHNTDDERDADFPASIQMRSLGEAVLRQRLTRNRRTRGFVPVPHLFSASRVLHNALQCLKNTRRF